MKKRKFFPVLIIQLILILGCYAQNNISSDWLINSKGEQWVTITCQVIDKEGDIITVGNFSPSIKLGKSKKTEPGKQSMFIAKINPVGHVKWLKHISGTGYCYGNSIVSAPDGSMYLCGNFQGTLTDGNTSMDSKLKKNTFILKLNSEGKVEWGTNIDGQFKNKNQFLALDKQNNLVFTGSFCGDLLLNQHHFESRNYFDIAVIKLDLTGNISDFNVIKGKDDDLVNGIVTDPDGNIILTGSFEKELEINNKIMLSNGAKDVFLITFDENLELKQAQSYGGLYDDIGNAVKFDHENNLLLAGIYNDRISFNGTDTLKSSGRSNVFLTKFNNPGKHLWCIDFGGTGNEYVSSLDINNMDDIYITGSYRGTIKTADRMIESRGFSTDQFLAKFNSNGVFRFIESLGGENDDFGRNLYINKSNDLFVNGNYSNELTVLNNCSTKSDHREVFISKLFDCSSGKKVKLPPDTTIYEEQFEISVQNNYKKYIWNDRPGSNQITIDSTDHYILEVIDNHNCVSKDTIYVQLKKPSAMDLDSTNNLVDCMIKEGNLVENPETDNNQVTANMISEAREQPLWINPNPVRDRLNIRITNLISDERTEIKLYSLEGTIFFETVLNAIDGEISLHIDVNKIPSGTYFLKVLTSNMNMQRIIVIL